MHIDFKRIGRTRSDLMRALHDRGVGTQVHYLPVHKQPYYQNKHGRIDLPGAEQYYASCLSLPMFPSMTHEDVDRVVEALRLELG